MFFSTGVVFASVAVLSNHSIDSYKIAAGIGEQFYLIALLLVFCTLLAFNLMNRCQKSIPASEPALIYPLEPGSTPFFATYFPLTSSPLFRISTHHKQLST